jgi:hypothetical protein
MAYNPNQYAGAAPQGFTQQQMQQPVQQAQQRYAAPIQQAQWQATQAPGAMRTTMGGRAIPNLVTPQTQAQMQVGNLQRQQQQAMGQAGQDAFTASELQRRENVRNELYGTARGREQELRDDPLNAAIRQRLQERIGGGGPFDDATRNAMLAQQAEMGDAAMAAQMRQMGGRPGDPAFEAQRRGLDLQRAQGMQGAARNIDMQRSLTNYNAMGQDLGQAASINQAQQAQVTDAQRFLQSLLGSEQFNAGMPAREISSDDYMRARLMMG